MAKGTYATIVLTTKDVDGSFERVQASGAEVVRPISRTASGIAPSAIPWATWSGLRRCAERPDRSTQRADIAAPSPPGACQPPPSARNRSTLAES